MPSLRHSLHRLALLAIAAGSMAAAHAQVGDGDAARRMRNREEAIERYQQMQRAGTTGMPPAAVPAPAPRAMPGGPRVHDHRHHHGHHRHHHMHRHPHHPG